MNTFLSTFLDQSVFYLYVKLTLLLSIFVCRKLPYVFCVAPDQLVYKDWAGTMYPSVSSGDHYLSVTRFLAATDTSSFYDLLLTIASVANTFFLHNPAGLPHFLCVEMRDK